jgi:hypothetical protein
MTPLVTLTAVDDRNRLGQETSPALLAETGGHAPRRVDR